MDIREDAIFKLERLLKLYKDTFNEDLLLIDIMKAVNGKMDELKKAMIDEFLSHYRNNNPEHIERLFGVKEILEEWTKTKTSRGITEAIPQDRVTQIFPSFKTGKGGSQGGVTIASTHTQQKKKY